MQEPTTQELARYIYTNGKLIHDRIVQIHTASLQSCCRGPAAIGELSFNQVQAVMAVHRRGEVNMTELSALLGVTPASASGMVDRLVEKGVLVRAHCQEDRRRVKVSVSPGALDQIRQIEAAVQQSFFDLVERLGEDTAREWCAVLGKIKNVLDAEQ